VEAPKVGGAQGSPKVKGGRENAKVTGGALRHGVWKGETAKMRDGRGGAREQR
jgi:hypothetical protein